MAGEGLTMTPTFCYPSIVERCTLSVGVIVTTNIGVDNGSHFFVSYKR